MADVQALITDLIKAGVPADLVGRVAATITEVSAPAPAVVDVAAEKRRAFDRERKREKRNSTGSPVDTNTDNSTGLSTGIPPESAPLACVGDNKLTTKEPCLSVSSLLCAKADLDPRDLRELERVLRDEGSPALNQTAPKLCIVAPILALLNGEAGPACDLHMDVLPVIRSKSKAVRPNSITGWEFYRPAILEARDKRLQTNPDVIPLDERRRSSAPAQQVEDEFEAAKRRVIEKYQ